MLTEKEKKLLKRLEKLVKYWRFLQIPFTIFISVAAFFFITGIIVGEKSFAAIWFLIGALILSEHLGERVQVRLYNIVKKLQQDSENTENQ